MKPPALLYCHCQYAQVLPPEVKLATLKALSESGQPFEAVPDLCELSARRDPALARLAAGGPVEDRRLLPASRQVAVPFRRCAPGRGPHRSRQPARAERDAGLRPPAQVRVAAEPARGKGREPGVSELRRGETAPREPVRPRPL